MGIECASIDDEFPVSADGEDTSEDRRSKKEAITANKLIMVKTKEEQEKLDTKVKRLAEEHEVADKNAHDYDVTSAEYEFKYVSFHDKISSDLTNLKKEIHQLASKSKNIKLLEGHIT